MSNAIARRAFLTMAAGAAAGWVVGPRLTAGAPNGRGPQQDIQVPGVTLRAYESPYYNIFTDVPEDDAREAVIRMTKMYDEYHDRTRFLFGGQINQRLPFYLFDKPQEYYLAGGMPRSAGVFNGQRLMAMSFRNKDGTIGMGTWHVVQHEGFHQFVFYVIRGQIPTWVNEGLAEYFAEGVFTGDGMVTGLISETRRHRVQEAIKDGTFKSLKDMMLMTHEAWNASIDIINYDQAWSMCHFLAEGDGGKYQNVFAMFLQLVGKGKTWEQAWIATFGSANGFEDRWKEFWLKQPENATIDLYAKADVMALTSFVGRAYTQKQTFDTFEEFVATDAKSLKSAPADWLPPQLYGEFQHMTDQLRSLGATFELTRNPKNKQPQVVCTMPDGVKITGSFDVQGVRIGKVRAELVKPTTAATKPTTAPVRK